MREAFPRATLIHALRDGRDVVCSLLERGWLSAERGGADDAGAAFGTHPRFWVEPGREEEFRARERRAPLRMGLAALRFRRARRAAFP